MAHVVGVDLSLTATGIASSTGWCQTVGRKGITSLPELERIPVLESLSRDILTLIKEPTLVVMESAAFGAVSSSARERAILSHLVLRSLLARAVPIALVNPMHLKIYIVGTGTGKAGKGPIINAVTRRWPDWDHGGDDNQADAVGLMAMGRDHLGEPLAPLPEQNRRALASVDWPQSLKVAPP